MHGLLHQQGIHGMHWHGGFTAGGAAVVSISCGTVGIIGNGVVVVVVVSSSNV